MPRTLIRSVVRSDTGPVIVNARVYPRLEGMVDPIPDLYAAETGGVLITSVVTNAQGEAIAWMDAYRDQVDLLVTDNADAAYLPGAVASTVSFADFTETVAVPAVSATFVDLMIAQTIGGAKTFTSTVKGVADVNSFGRGAAGAAGPYLEVQTDAADVYLSARSSTADAWMIFVPKGNGKLDFRGPTTGRKFAVSDVGLGFYGIDPIAKPTGVAVTAAAIHAALVNLNLIGA